MKYVTKAISILTLLSIIITVTWKMSEFLIKDKMRDTVMSGIAIKQEEIIGKLDGLKITTDSALIFSKKAVELSKTNMQVNLMIAKKVKKINIIDIYKKYLWGALDTLTRPNLLLTNK